MSVAQTGWLVCLLPSYWLTRANAVLPEGLEPEKLVIMVLSVLLVPTVLGAFLGILWKILWVFLVGLFALIASVFLFKALLPQAPCSPSDMIISILISAGFYIPTCVLDCVAAIARMATSKQEIEEYKDADNLLEEKELKEKKSTN